MSGQRPDESESTVLYVVVEARWESGDVIGCSMTADRVWFEHMSSSVTWLRQDTTTGFRDRRDLLEAAYPNGLVVKVVDLTNGDELPEEIEHHFTREEVSA